MKENGERLKSEPQHTTVNMHDVDRMISILLTFYVVGWRGRKSEGILHCNNEQTKFIEWKIWVLINSENSLNRFEYIRKRLLLQAFRGGGFFLCVSLLWYHVRDSYGF